MMPTVSGRAPPLSHTSRASQLRPKGYLRADSLAHQRLASERSQAQAGRVDSSRCHARQTQQGGGPACNLGKSAGILASGSRQNCRRGLSRDASTCCRSTADGQPEPPSEPPQRDGGAVKGGTDSSSSNAQWAEMVLSLPLELAAASAKTNDHWLQKRKRKRWWKRQEFPRVPMDTMQDVHASMEPPVTLWQKLLPLALVFFCASFNLTILANLKDAIVVTSAGAEALPFLASFCVLPASLAFFFAYGRLVEMVPQRTVFFAAVIPLVVFYAIFAGALYPASVHLHPHGFYERMAPIVPLGLHGLLKVIEHWTFSLFFCIAELWGSVVISVLFWTLANDVCTVADAKVIYPLMGIAANIALVVAGNYMKWVNKAFTQGSLQASLRFLVTTVVVMSCVMMAAKAGVNDLSFLPQAYIDRNIQPAEVAAPKTAKKKKGNMADSIAVLKSSPKIMNLALLVVSYGVSHRLFEFAWKGQLRVLYPSAQQYQGMLADVSIATGWATIALMLTGRFVFQYLGWGVAATATPVVMLLAGGTFFGTSIMSQVGTGAASTLAVAGATAGAVTQVFARSSKFSLFDPAKEMVYIEMSKEEKSKGKAAVDLVGSQIGKSGASWIAQALLLVTGSIQAALPVIAGVFGTVIILWIRAVSSLGNTIKREEAEAAAAKASVEESGSETDADGLQRGSATAAGAPHSDALVATAQHSTGAHAVDAAPLQRQHGIVSGALEDGEAGTSGGGPDGGHAGQLSVNNSATS